MDTAAVIDRAADIVALPSFDGPGLWLTFYLCAGQAELNNAGERLAGLGAVNLDDAEGGFLYPKLPVQRDPLAIAALVEQVCEIASASKAKVVGVDVDTSSDVKTSSFKQLINFY